ncbi:MAG: 23S rRNA (uridine(2552)-2'-O)-methyltransferase RlmE [Gammaproteobacteria bacterium]
MARSKSSKRWLREHFDDKYVKQAQKGGYRARSAFKLLEIQQKDHLIQSGMIIVDLGAAPGGWSQVVIEILKGKGKVFALDVLPMESINGVEFIQGDFREEQVMHELLDCMQQQKADLVLSDMAPNISGIKATDQARAMYLAELALDFAKRVLKPGGNFLVKVFQGADFEEFLKAMRKNFSKVITRKPQASRDRSTEIYLLGREFKG